MTFHSPSASNVTEMASSSSGVRTAAHILEFLADPARVRTASWIARFFGTSPIARESAALYRDAIAELAVADSVNSLGSGWRVIHDIDPGGDGSAHSSRVRDVISHLIVGANGVFAVTAVNVQGEPVWVASSGFVQGGVRMPHLRDAEYNALRLSQRLFELSGIRVEVIPAVVVATPRDLIINRPPRRVSVLTPSEVGAWVRSHSNTVGAEEAASIVGAARRLAANGDSAGESISDSFDRMRRVRTAVRSARRIRIAWVTAGLVGLWVVLVFVMMYRHAWL